MLWHNAVDYFHFIVMLLRWGRSAQIAFQERSHSLSPKHVIASLYVCQPRSQEIIQLFAWLVFWDISLMSSQTSWVSTKTHKVAQGGERIERGGVSPSGNGKWLNQLSYWKELAFRPHCCFMTLTCYIFETIILSIIIKSCSWHFLLRFESRKVESISRDYVLQWFTTYSV